MTKLNLGIIYGGISPEHEVSVITAVQAMAAASGKYNIIPLYVGKDGQLYTGERLKAIETYQDLPQIPKLARSMILPSSPGLPITTMSSSPLKPHQKLHLDLLFPCFHGGVGEGGWIQGLAEFLNIPLMSTGLTGAAIGMDKILMKNAFAAAGLHQAAYHWFYRQEWQRDKSKKAITTKLVKTLSFPMFVKPSRGGSSIGTTKAKDQEELVRAIDLAAALDTRIIVEEGIINAREINISVLGNAGEELSTSVCEEVFADKGSDFLNFEDKYLKGGKKSRGMASTNREIPAKIDPALAGKVAKTAKDIFRLLDCAGLVRIDFLVKNNEVYVIEINTIPGSLSFYLWEASDIPYPKLVDRLVQHALDHHKETSKTTTTFGSNILESFATQSAGKLGKLKKF